LISYSQFPDAFAGQEGKIFRRLILISKEGQQPLVLRLLALHWLMGLVDSISNRDVEKRKLIAGMGSSFYPSVYDALALKPLKLDLLALCSVVVDATESYEGVSRMSALNYFEDGLICVSAFKWPPPWNTETAVAFRTIYKFLIEVRDNTRISLRMLICIPGKKLRHILNLGDQLVGISPSPHTSSFFNVQSPRISQDLKKSRNISAYIHLERAIPLIVKQSWSLSLPALGFQVEKYGYIEGTKDRESHMSGKDSNVDNNIEIIPDIKRIEQPQEPLRVMDSKISEIVNILRMHFLCIPDYRHMPGLKIKIPCILRFQSEPFIRIWGSDSSGKNVEELKVIPAMYAIVLKFSSSAPYGSIPSYHIPFLLGEPFSGESLPAHGSMDIVPVGTPPTETLGSGSPVTIELEPREPVPAVVDVSIDANADNGQIIRGKLQGVAVGIEDMFLKAVFPAEIPEDELPEYYSRLFDALWEACGSSSNTGREMFALKGGKGFAAIYGTQSVKLLDVPANFAVRVIEQYLADFVVSVIGTSLVEIVKDGSFIKDVTWVDMVSDCADESKSIMVSDGGPLYLTYFDNEDDKYSKANIGKTNMGCFLVLIFLPPQYHLLFRMEVSHVSTLVRIRTDHWPCLAYVDEFLEALFSL